MYCRLRDGLSFCQVDGRLIFLDLDNDRYFQLPTRLEHVLTDGSDSGERTDAARTELIRRRILIEAPSPQPSISGATIKAPSRSALEHRLQRPSLSYFVLFEVLVLICTTQLHLKTRKLRNIIASLTADRCNRAAGVIAGSTGPLPPSLAEAAAAFMQARPYIPIEPCCLLDSLSMVRFLARRQLSASLVFAVTIDPFSAHCWVQAGDWVLNDTVGNAIQHTPIRVI